MERAVLFDVMGTLFDLEPLRGRLVELGAAPPTLEAWFERALDNARVLTILDRFEPFDELAEAALQTTLAQQGLDPDDAKQVLELMSQLPAAPDAAAAFDRLESAGVGVAVLTNGGEQQTRQLLEQAGLDDRVAGIFTTAQVSAYKPAAAPYLEAVEQLGLEPQQVTLIAAHGWDVLGAQAAKLQAIWVDRLERCWPFPLGEPRRAASLEEAAAMVAGG